MSATLQIRKKTVTNTGAIIETTGAMIETNEENRKVHHLQAVPSIPVDRNWKEKVERLEAKVKDLEKQLMSRERLLRQKEILLRNAERRELELRSQVAHIIVH